METLELNTNKESSSLEPKKCNHQWKLSQNREACELCGKKGKLILKKSGVDGILVGVKDNGEEYAVRRDTNKFLYPEQWNRLIESLRPKNRLIFKMLIGTGARIDEALHIRPCDFKWERRTLELVHTKSKAKKGESKELGGKPRSFVVSTQLCKDIKQYLREIGVDSPYDTKDLIFDFTQKSVYKLFKAKLKEIEVKDWQLFGLHSIRKTHGMWLKSLVPYSREITIEEICLRLGHDMNTYLKHYGSPSVFNDRDKNMMIQILGDIYGLK